MRKVSRIFNINEDPTSVLPHDNIVTEDRVGVEIELEHFVARRHTVDLKYWDLKDDGSLRNSGVEFVFKSPLAGADIVNALDEFSSFINKRTVVASERCSVHVHVDVRDMSSIELMKFIALSVMYENVLFNLGGRHRKKNPFCLPVGENINSMYILADLMAYSELNIEEYEDRLRYSIDDTTRYSSFNLQSLARFGTIEFRMHEGTIDTSRMLTWINTLLSIKEFAKVMNHKWRDIPNVISESGLQQFTRNVFGEVYEKITYRNMVDDIMSGLRQLQDIIVMSRRTSDKRLSSKYKLDKCSDLFKKKAEFHKVPEDVEDEAIRVSEDLFSSWVTNPYTTNFFNIDDEQMRRIRTALSENSRVAIDDTSSD